MFASERCRWNEEQYKPRSDLRVHCLFILSQNFTILHLKYRTAPSTVTRKTEIHWMTEIRRKLPKSAENTSILHLIIVILFELLLSSLLSSSSLFLFDITDFSKLMASLTAENRHYDMRQKYLSCFFHI